MASIRCGDAAWTLVAVEGEDKRAEFCVPERGVETAAQACGLLVQCSTMQVAAEPARDGGGSPLGRIDIGLHFDECDRTLSQGAIQMEDRIMAVLPALVAQAFARAPAVFDEA